MIIIHMRNDLLNCHSSWLDGMVSNVRADRQTSCQNIEDFLGEELKKEPRNSCRKLFILLQKISALLLLELETVL